LSIAAWPGRSFFFSLKASSLFSFPVFAWRVTIGPGRALVSFFVPVFLPGHQLLFEQRFNERAHDVLPDLWKRPWGRTPHLTEDASAGISCSAGQCATPRPDRSLWKVLFVK
jgi:hypothetical protein